MEQSAKLSARLRKINERKRKRRPSQWGPEEKSNPDYQWLEFEKMMKELVTGPVKNSQVEAAKAYLMMSCRKKQKPVEPLTRAERKRLLVLLREYMVQENGIPGLYWYKRNRKRIKKKL